MPAISRFFGIVIAMYFDDHGPPHFHARHAGGRAKIRVDTLEVIESTSGVGSCASYSPGPSYTKKSSRRTGAAPAPVRHSTR